jgi:hypothetical protein
MLDPGVLCSWASEKEGIPWWYHYSINPIKPWVRMSHDPTALVRGFWWRLVQNEEGQGGSLLRASQARWGGGMGWRWHLLSLCNGSRWGRSSVVLRWWWRSQWVCGTPEMLLDRLLGHGRQQNNAAVLSSSLLVAMGKMGGRSPAGSYL